MSTIEFWIVEHYGPIEHATLGADPLIAHAVAIPTLNGVSIGMGISREQAIEKLYTELTDIKVGGGSQA